MALWESILGLTAMIEQDINHASQLLSALVVLAEVAEDHSPRGYPELRGCPPFDTSQGPRSSDRVRATNTRASTIVSNVSGVIPVISMVLLRPARTGHHSSY